MLTIFDRIPHEKLPCLKACTRVLACGHKCSGVCTDPCRCREDCDQFKALEAERRLAQLQLQVAPLPPATTPSPALEHERDSSPEKWVAFSKNPQAHDDAIRKARLEAMGPSIELDTPPTSAAPPEKNVIKERFIPISNRNGVRVIEKEAGPHGRCLPKAPAQGNSRNTGRRRVNGQQQRQGPQTPAHSRNTFKGMRAEAVSTMQNGGKSSARPNGQRGQLRGRPTLHQNKPNQRRQPQLAPHKSTTRAGSGVPEQPLINLLDKVEPARDEAPADSVSLAGESDLGFEAEVLGIRRGSRRTDQGPANARPVLEKVQEVVGADAESLMSFGGDGAVSPTSTALAAKNEKEEELLIDI